MAYTLKEQVQVAIVIDGEAVSETYGPGDVKLPKAVADLLVAQGLATPAKAKSAKAASNDEIGE